MAFRDDDYKFLQIEDAVPSINQKVNLIGVVLETSIPRRSKGTDCFCAIKIVDESHPTHGIPINIFAGNMEELPHVESSGDIIQFSRVVMKTHRGEVYALYNKKFSAFALFHGKYSTDFAPYQVSSNFHPRDQDKKFIVGLRKWLVDNQLDTGSNEPVSLKDIREAERVNLVCKVLHSCEVIKDEWLVFLWDGTDTPPVAIQSKLEKEMEHPLPLQLEAHPLPKDVLCKFPDVGTVLRANIGQSNEIFGLHLLRVGRWVKFVSLSFQIHAGLWRGLLMPFTRLRYLRDDDDLVLQLQKSYNARVQSRWARMPTSSIPWSSCVTDTNHKHVPVVSLMNILTYAEVPAKFKCVVRVVAALPWRAEDFRSPLGTYRIRLTLEDPTARIHAFVYAEDGEYLFGGYPSLDKLTRMRNTLLGIAQTDDGREIQDAPRNPPWLLCCLKSYYLDKDDQWGSRRYRIFDTQFLD